MGELARLPEELNRSRELVPVIRSLELTQLKA